MNETVPVTADDLIAAVKQNDVKKLKGYLDRAANPNLQDKDGDTALHSAASKCRSDCVALLLDRAADPNLQNENGVTALHFAASEGFSDCVALLLDRAADPNLQNKNGDTALHWAVFWNHPDLAALLLDRAADPNLQDKNGDTALHWAVWQGHSDCVALLLDRAADPNLQDKDGDIALDIALRKYNETHYDKYKKIADMLTRAMEERRLEDKMESNIKRLIRGKRNIPPILDKWLVDPKGKRKERG